MLSIKCILSSCLLVVAAVAHSEESWKVDEKKILHLSQQENLPVVAVFLSAEGCPWSHKFVAEVLQSPDFVGRVGIDAILWEILLGKEKEDLSMRQKYGVQQSPQILLLDPRGKEFARLGYSPLSAPAYAKQIMGLIDAFQEVCVALDRRDAPFEEQTWKDLYLKAKQFSVPCFKQVILEKGLKKEKGTFFHLEKYALMLEKLKAKHPAVLKMKAQLLKGQDPETHYSVAVLDFQKKVATLKPKDNWEKALTPLVHYIHQFNKKGSKNLWKAELMIAEFLYLKNALPAALEHAEASLKAAPESAQPQVLQIISHIKKTYEPIPLLDNHAF